MVSVCILLKKIVQRLYLLHYYDVRNYSHFTSTLYKSLCEQNETRLKHRMTTLRFNMHYKVNTWYMSKTWPNQRFIYEGTYNSIGQWVLHSHTVWRHTARTSLFQCFLPKFNPTEKISKQTWYNFKNVYVYSRWYDPIETPGSSNWYRDAYVYLSTSQVLVLQRGHETVYRCWGLHKRC